MAATMVWIALIVSGCGSGSETAGSGDAPESTAAVNATVAAPETTAAVDEARCLDVPPAVLDRISAGLTISGAGGLGRASAVQSSDYESVYFVSAELEGPGIDGEIATWATNGLGAGGLTYSVDALAREFSDWADGGATQAELTMDRDGADESRECLVG